MDSFTKKIVICVLLWTTCVSESLSRKSELLNDDANQVEKFCPKNCRCDLYNELRRADCSDQNLINTFAGKI